MADSLSQSIHLSDLPHQEPHPNQGIVRIWTPAFAVLLAIPIILACGATPTVVSQAPASDLTLDITIADQFAATAQVAIEVKPLLARHAGSSILSIAHTLTCNGIAIPIASLDVKAQAQVPRQPPGGTYTFVYTDEQGRHTALVVPVPRGTFAVTSPRDGATIKVPQRPSFAATPSTTTSAPPTGNPGATSVVSIPLTPTPPGQIRDPNLVSQPPVIVRYAMPDMPANASTTFQATANCGRIGEWLCGTIPGPALAASGTYALTDATVADGFGFERFVAGPGEIDTGFTAAWPLLPGGFVAASVTYDAFAQIPIDWTR